MRNNKLLKVFSEWKKWVILHGVLPKSQSEDKNEQSIYRRFSYALKVFRKNPQKYGEEIKQYNLLFQKYSEKTIQKRYKEKFEFWKIWVKENKRLPSQSSKDPFERSLYCYMYRIFKSFECQKDIYGEEAKEFEQICNKYKMPCGDAMIGLFEEWKLWCIEHNRTPRHNSTDEYEVKLHYKINTYIFRMKNDKEKYSDILQEYEDINAKYNHKLSMREFAFDTFVEWKKWVKENQTLPSEASEDNYEKTLVNNINFAVAYFKKNISKYMNIIDEYEDIHNMYNLNGSYYISRDRIYKCWKTWVRKNGHLTSSQSEDKYERFLHSKILSYIKSLKKDREKNLSIISEYEIICYEYKTRQRKENFLKQDN